VLTFGFLACCAGFAGGQFATTAIPSNDQALKGELERISRLPVPSDPIALQEEIETARTTVDSFKRAISGDSGDAQWLNARHEDFSRGVRELQCDNARKGLAYLSSDLNAIFASGRFSKEPLISVLASAQNKSDPDMCKQITSGTMRDELMHVVDATFQNASDSVKWNNTVGTQLQNAWTERQRVLLKAQAESTDLKKSMLWVLAAIFGFAVLSIYLLLMLPGPLRVEFIKTGQLIQFPTVMVLVAVISVLGIVGILKENSLSARLVA
jgi:hypothetical protein